jgi:hypothetical protein
MGKAVAGTQHVGMIGAKPTFQSFDTPTMKRRRFVQAPRAVKALG